MKLTDYETAKALKELGFDEPMCKFYTEGELDEGDCSAKASDVEHYSGMEVLPCPYLPQAADFLREQYGVHVTTAPLEEWNHEATKLVKNDLRYWFYEVYTESGKIIGSDLTEGDPFPDHDTALQEGIKKGIEVVREKCETHS